MARGREKHFDLDYEVRFTARWSSPSKTGRPLFAFSATGPETHFKFREQVRGQKRERRRNLCIPITTLVEYDARLATNGVILCRCGIPFFEVHMMFEFDGARGMRARIHLPSLVDEFVRVKLKALSHA